MDYNSNKTDKYFRDRLSNFEEGPPESTWESIVQKLDNKRKKRMILLVFRIAAGMAILVSTGLGYFLLHQDGDTPRPTAVSVNKQVNNNTVTVPDASVSQTEVPVQVSPEIIRNEAAIAGTNQPKDITGNETITGESTITINENTFPIGELTRPAIEKTGVNGHDSYYLSMIDNIGSPYVYTDSSYKEIDFNDVPSDSGLSAEEAAALLLADYYGDEEPVKADRQRWLLGSEVAPLYSYRSFSSNQVNSSVIQDFNKNESGILAYAGGIRIGFSTSKRLSVQSGIYYSRYGQEKNNIQAVSSSGSDNKNNYQFISVSNSTGTISGVVDEKNSRGLYNELDVISQQDYTAGIVNANVHPLVRGGAEDAVLKQYFDYFEVPLILKYKIIDRKIDFSFSGGLVTNFLVGNSVNMINDGKTTRITETDNINQINYQGSLGMGLEYPIKSNFALTLEPRFRYFFNTIDKSSSAVANNPFVHPFSFGFFAGINYRF